MVDLPRGTVTFLFTDIEGSTALWERDRAAMATAVERHLALLRDAVSAHDGVLFKVVGDAAQAAFPPLPRPSRRLSMPSVPYSRQIWARSAPCGSAWHSMPGTQSRTTATISPPR